MTPRPSVSRLQEQVESVVRRQERNNEREVWNACMEEKFEGRVSGIMLVELTRYGMEEIAVLVRTGLIHGRTAMYRDPLARDFRWNDPEIAGLVGLIVTHGVRKFTKDALAGSGWSPDGASSLPSFFKGACLMVAGQARREWRPARGPEVLLADALPDQGEAAAGLDDLEIAEFIRRNSDLGGEDIAKLLRMKLDDRSTKEIAHALGTSPKAVERRWARLKEKLRRRLP
jgi:hypothetical protein